MKDVVSIDPATGELLEVVTQETSTSEVAAVCQAAAAAAVQYERGGRRLWSAVLRAVADGLEARREEIVAVGISETALASVRLEGELTRTVYQARFFADVVDDGAYLEATIDHPAQTPMGPGPDLRRLLVPLGPVAVFGASNFPLAFSVPGGDTISALAAGCPVIVKAHDAHPRLSSLTFDVLRTAARSAGAPDGVVGLVFGLQAGIDLVSHPAIRAVGFTGSQSGGTALADAASRRDEPIPVFAEMSSLNPVVVTVGAARERAADFAEGLVASISASGGQLCTKPGVVLVPAGPHGDALVGQVRERVAKLSSATLLSSRIRSSYESFAADRVDEPGWTSLSEAEDPGDGIAVPPRVFEVAPEVVRAGGIEECFGPTTVVVRYQPGEELDLLSALPGSLTVTIHGQEDERDTIDAVASVAARRSGRILFDGYPTGVLVSWAQHHGGPWPSTNAQHTSVGASAVRRFQRPLTFQSAPDWVLPDALLDQPAEPLTRRVDGLLVTVQ